MSTNKLITLDNLTSYNEKIKSFIETSDTALENKINNKIDSLYHAEPLIVDSLPTQGQPDYIYFVLKTDGYSSSDQNIYEEYLWIKKSAEKYTYNSVDYTTEDEAVAAGGTVGVDIVKTDAVYGFEKLGDTKIDLETLKSEISDEVAGSYVASVEVSDEVSTVNAITTKTYTISFKNGSGVEVDSETISAISNIGVVVKDVTGDNPITGYDGLMTKTDKAELDRLIAEQDNYILTTAADAKYVATAEIGAYGAVDNGDGSTTNTATVTLSASDGTQLDTFDVVNTTYAEAQSAVEADPDNNIVGKAAVGGLLSAADKVKIDNMAGNAANTYVASADITSGTPVVTGNTSVTTVTLSLKNGNGAEIDSDTFDVTTYGEASQTDNGLMSAADKLKLDEMEYAEESDIIALFPSA